METAVPMESCFGHSGQLRFMIRVDLLFRVKLYKLSKSENRTTPFCLSSIDSIAKVAENSIKRIRKSYCLLPDALKSIMIMIETNNVSPTIPEASHWLRYSLCGFC